LRSRSEDLQSVCGQHIADPCIGVVHAIEAANLAAFGQPRSRRSRTLPEGGDAERQLTLLGLVGMQDPPRPEAREAVARCKRAGIRTVMITGDHPDTARAVARELGILEASDEVLAGQDLESMSDETFAAGYGR
jgi:Ca2+-transporting ATPase